MCPSVRSNQCSRIYLVERVGVQKRGSQGQDGMPLGELLTITRCVPAPVLARVLRQALPAPRALTVFGECRSTVSVPLTRAVHAAVAVKKHHQRPQTILAQTLKIGTTVMAIFAVSGRLESAGALHLASRESPGMQSGVPSPTTATTTDFQQPTLVVTVVAGMFVHTVRVTTCHWTTVPLGKTTTGSHARCTRP